MRPILTIGALCAIFISSSCDAGRSAQLEANKALVQQFGEAGNAADWASLGDLLTDDFTRHSAATPGPPVTSRDAFIELQQAFLQSFPDQRVTVHEMVAEGDYVAVRATYSGTQTGPMGEFPATGQSASSPFLGLFRIEEGRIAELWASGTTWRC